MTDEKRKKKLGLSLKTSKKPVIGCNEKSRNITRHFSTNVLPVKSKISTHSKSVVVDIDDFSDLKAQQSKSNCEIKKTTDSDQRDKEKLLWRNIFSAERQLNWENLEDLPKFDSVTYMKKQNDTNITATRKEMFCSEHNDVGHITYTENDHSSNYNCYIELPRPCISCYKRKPVKLEYISQSTEKEVEIILRNEVPQGSKTKFSKHSLNNENNSSRSVSPVVEDIDDDEMLRMLDDEVSQKRKIIDCDQDLESGFHQTKRPSLENNRPDIGCREIDDINMHMSKEKHIKKHDQSNCQENKNNSVFHGIPNDKHKFSSDVNRKHVPKLINDQEGFPKQQTHNFSPKNHSSYFQKKYLASERSFPKDNMVIDLTDDKTEPESSNLHQSNVFNRKPNSYKSFGEKKSSSENLTGISKGYSMKEKLRSCPMCELKFSSRESKEDIEKHISSCIGDEVIDDRNSDEDWLFVH